MTFVDSKSWFTRDSLSILSKESYLTRSDDHQIYISSIHSYINSYIIIIIYLIQQYIISL
jgi:hypothetical protein